MSLSMILPPGAADAERRRRLRTMKSVAIGLLLLAAVVYLLTRDAGGFWGYVNAGAEASMVGAIADWFAVTALFKHPLGLPIPHTALIPRKKDELGKSLEDFVQENFLQEEIIRDRLAAAQIAARAGEWIRERPHAARVVAEGASLLTLGLKRLKDSDVEAVVAEVLLPRLVAEPISPIAGNLLSEVLADDAHHGLVDLALEEGHHWLVHNQETFTAVLGERAPWWAPDRLNEVVTDRIHLETIRWIADIRADPHHRARAALDSLLRQLADDLLTDPDTQARAERLKTRLLEHPQFLSSGMALFDALRSALLDALADDQGPLRERATTELQAFGNRLGADPALRARIDEWAAEAAVFGVNRYGGELTAVITHTIARWDGREAASRIELQVGRDLQFIRINGTIVGGLVGVLIHAVSAAL
ncbi:DUF445 domain-containing protein [Nocardioides marmoriginsengisoli]|uniref:DUF445 domain-containing protein n=1 Tax=Nocardioides marmoriginsengisoli TaxID=661483 RepID=A0A3N0CPR5_9ACTN|nr:DUF445 domain-containing protein [Nocardioides marmoriginsengisoli]RNL65301.1 DUF445 domain-containing protein [Nocardioides marmoriginsengisoli]